MEELIRQLTLLFQQNFPGSTSQLEQARPLQKVGGFLFWNGFTGIEQLDRQRQMGAVIRQLPLEERTQVTTILTLTPEEAVVRQTG